MPDFVKNLPKSYKQSSSGFSSTLHTIINPQVYNRMLKSWRPRPLGLRCSVTKSRQITVFYVRATVQPDHESLINKPFVIPSSPLEPPEIQSVDVPNPSDFGGGLVTLLFGSALLSERLNGMGIVQQLELHQGWHPFVLASIAILTIAGLWPGKKNNGEPLTGIARLRKVATRGAYLGLAATLAGELLTGKGVLALLDFETGVEEVSDIEAICAFFSMYFLTKPPRRQS